MKLEETNAVFRAIREGVEPTKLAFGLAETICKRNLLSCQQSLYQSVLVQGEDIQFLDVV